MGRPKKTDPRALGPYRCGKRWQLVLVGPDGRRKNEFFPTKRAALAAQRGAAEEAQRKVKTTAEALDEFCAAKLEEGRKDGTVATYRYAVQAMFPSPIPLWALTPNAVQRQYRALHDEVAPTTHRGYLSQTRTFLGWCVEQGYLAVNPAAEVKGVGAKAKGKQQLRVSELQIWDSTAHGLAAEGDEGAVAALFALWLAERATEIVTARACHVFARERPGDTIEIPDSKTRAGIRILEIAVPLSDYVAALCEGKRPGDYLWPAQRGETGHHYRDWVRDQVHRVCDLAGVPRVCAHAMRGAHATLGALRGDTSHALARQLGHENPLVTVEHYARPGSFDGARQRAALTVLRGGKK